MAEWKVPGYTELTTLGSGGFGEVVLARHNVSGTLVAVKYLRPELLADPEFTRMFRGEAQVLASLDDANVVRLYEYVESPSGAAIVMELVDGVSLREILSRQGKTTAEAALVVLQGSLLGLAAAHRRGVVHRDYKPENVLVAGNGASKLTDFGIAARAGDSPLPAGTLAYAPPEQFAGAPASPASDVYAATATFYECLAGRPPFTGNTADALLRQHQSQPVPLDPVPEPLRPLVAIGMAKEPARRPADGTSFVTALHTAAAGAYGPDWQQRGRSHLGEAALLLAALWPHGAPPAVQGTAVHRIWIRRLFRLRHFSPTHPVGRRGRCRDRGGSGGHGSRRHRHVHAQRRDPSHRGTIAIGIAAAVAGLVRAGLVRAGLVRAAVPGTGVPVPGTGVPLSIADLGSPVPLSLTDADFGLPVTVTVSVADLGLPVTVSVADLGLALPVSFAGLGVPVSFALPVPIAHPGVRPSRQRVPVGRHRLHQGRNLSRSQRADQQRLRRLRAAMVLDGRPGLFLRRAALLDRGRDIPEHHVVRPQSDVPGIRRPEPLGRSGAHVRGRRRRRHRLGL